MSALKYVRRFRQKRYRRRQLHEEPSAITEPLGAPGRPVTGPAALGLGVPSASPGWRAGDSGEQRKKERNRAAAATKGPPAETPAPAPRHMRVRVQMARELGERAVPGMAGAARSWLLPPVEHRTLGLSSGPDCGGGGGGVVGSRPRGSTLLGVGSTSSLCAPPPTPPLARACSLSNK